MAIQLNQKNLSEISKHVPSPGYDRSALNAGFVHIGVGGFHRSHQAYYLQKLIEQGGCLDWAICGVGLREGDRNIYDTLLAQDHLYTLMIKAPDDSVCYEVIGTINEMLLSVDTPDKVIDRLAHRDTKIVSLTITEGGYNFHASGDFNFENPDIQHDLDSPESPKSVFGYLALALRLRRDAGIPAFTIMSCDNIQKNGDTARKTLLAFVERQDFKLAQWIEQEVTFPNSMVDRITPVTETKDIDYLKVEQGIVDQWPVVCEPFIQWIVEDNFVNRRPELESVGVQFVDDVTPYEEMKLQLLNAGHSILGIIGAIHGYQTIDECVEDDILSLFLRKFMDKEVTPILSPVEGINIEEYKDSLLKRFSNSNIKDSVSRICSESSSKLPKFLIPTIVENLESDGYIELGAFVLAAWCMYSDREISEKGVQLKVIDAMQQQLNSYASKTISDPLHFLKLTEVFGDLAVNQQFTDAYRKHVNNLYKKTGILEQAKLVVEKLQ